MQTTPQNHQRRLERGSALWGRPGVPGRVGLSKSTIYAMIRVGRFPNSISIGERARAFDADEVDKWIAGRVAAQKGGA